MTEHHQPRDTQEQDRQAEAEWKFRALFEKGPIAVAYHRMIRDDSGRAVDYLFLDANERYLELTGVDPRGKTVLEAFPGIENDPFDWIGTFGRVAETGEEVRFEQHLQANGRWYDVVGYRYRPDHFVAAFLEITERKEMERRLRGALEEKDALMRELNHRVKNNLSIVSSFISLKEAEEGSDLSDLKHQVNAISIVHEKLYSSGNVSRIRAQEYLTDLLRSIFEPFSRQDVEVAVEAEGIELPTETVVPLGLIVNELATNAIKHGFVPGERAAFSAVLREDREKGRYTLVVCNSGSPFPEERGLENPHTLGLSLVVTLVSQLRGTVELEKRPRTLFRIVFPMRQGDD